MKNLTISLIVTTYNWPAALQCVLSSILQQTFPFESIEVIIADDGSTDETKTLIKSWQDRFPCPLVHIWQEDKGFRAAKIRNLAAKAARHDYLIFIDGDCMIGPQFLQRHANLAEKNWFVAGNRLLLSPEFSQVVLDGESVHQYRLKQWLSLYQQGKVNRILPYLSLPLGPLRKWGRTRWEGAKTCNLAIWRDDFFSVNGLDECYEGWGFEDSDLVVRLINNKIYKKSGRFSAPVYHIYHPEANRALTSANYQALQKTIITKKVLAEKGLTQYQS